MESHDLAVAGIAVYASLPVPRGPLEASILLCGQELLVWMRRHSRALGFSKIDWRLKAEAGVEVVYFKSRNGDEVTGGCL